MSDGGLDLRAEIERVSGQVEPITLDEVLSHPVVGYDAESDTDVAVTGGGAEPATTVVVLESVPKGRGRRITGLFAAAAAVLAVVGIAMRQSEDSVSTDDELAGGDDAKVSTRAQRLPDMSGVSGTVQTPLGPLAWVHASDAGELLPSPGSVIRTPTGVRRDRAGGGLC
jgi:hypothetical protein